MNPAEKYHFLKKALMSLYGSCSEKELLSVIKHQLPQICQVDLIELSDTQWQGIKYTDTYSFTHNHQEYFIHFHRAKAFSKVHRGFLKKVGKAIERALISWQKESQLKSIKEQWEMAFDAISLPISLTDKKDCILRTNRAFREILKKSKKELLGKNSFEVFFKKPVTLTDNKKTQEKTSINGTEKTYEITRENLTGFEMYLLVFRDISKKIKMEREIALSERTTEIDIISHSIAHELNNPVAGVQALLQTMLAKGGDKAKNKKPLQEMEQAIQRCGQIVQELLKPK